MRRKKSSNARSSPSSGDRTRTRLPSRSPTSFGKAPIVWVTVLMSSPLASCSLGCRFAMHRFCWPEDLRFVVQLVGPHQEHGPDTAVQHTPCHAPEDDGPEAGAPVRRYDDEVEPKVFWPTEAM